MSSATNQRDGSVLFSSWLFLNRPNCFATFFVVVVGYTHTDTHKKKVSISSS
jgi:hypothetical protein